ncbi:UNVERIFIED_CONTAM: Retrovirus-related Pol polyprotein from type-2 retrotransposable element R2DM [Sesamum calycinum]|uniref:Retrovirus-related Pol polyprotein from type-2 retrotransposable element R2DM n=1 Tax=Sesamum calycinum TaxID=2727403 RepID=A0AAW2N5F6_9LAMI
MRGLNRPLKQNGVTHLIKNNRLCLLGIFETKLAATAIPKIIDRLFPVWCQANNFDAIAGGCILIIWNPAVIDLHPEDISPQMIHCRVTNKSSELSFYISFTYGLYTVVNRSSMWEKLLQLGRPLSMPWIILGDFNCVKSPAEKQLGVPPTWYELMDFADCCLALGLHDAQTTGCYYTWYSNSDSNPVWCKLDRVLLNNDWLEAGLHCTAHFNHLGYLSDHSPSIVSIFDNPAPKPKSFRLFNIKLKALKSSLKAFNNLHYGHISARTKEADLALQNAQTHLESYPGDVVVRDSLGDLRKKTTFLAEAERHFYYQKAKIHFLKQGDMNTKFFHDMRKRNATRNSILTITKVDCSSITSAPNIAQQFVDFYTSLLGIEDQILPIDDGFFIRGPRSFRSLPRTFVGQSHRQRAVMDFFRSGRMLRQLNHTIIALVPKSEHSPSVADYRPISCCNVIYKVITKIIADRLSPALEQLIDSSQAAFVGGQNITDSIFLAQEMVRQYSRKRISPRCTINVDLQKAFDSVSWTFLSRVLHEYGFPPLFISWIMECVSTTFSVALNGSLHGLFPGKKGLRQGDPMSPALFLLCMEYFSRLIKRNTTNSDFNFHPKCEKLKITHLLFADDLMLFSRGDLPSIHILMECFQEFRDVSGLAVNTAKSNIFTAGIQNDTFDETLAMTEFARGHMPVRYLGIPLAAQRLSVTDYSPLVDQIVACICNRRSSPYLSLVGWSLYAPLSKEWSAFGSKYSLSQWQLLKRSIVCAGPSYGIPREHRWPGRIFVIRRRKAV